MFIFTFIFTLATTVYDIFIYLVECLLAIVEFTEYEEYVLDNFSDYVSSKHDYRAQLIKLPNNVPQSLIVYGSSKQKEEPKLPALRPWNSSTKRTMENTEKENTPTIVTSAEVVDPPSSDTQRSATLPKMDALAHSSSKNRDREYKLTRKNTKGLYADLRPFQSKAKLLYDKYIRDGAEFEINISYGMRGTFHNMLNNEQLWSAVFDHSSKNSAKMQAEKIISENLDQILTLLNGSIEEMVRLLSHSFARFQQTEIFQKLL